MYSFQWYWTHKISSKINSQQISQLFGAGKMFAVTSVIFVGTYKEDLLVELKRVLHRHFINKLGEWANTFNLLINSMFKQILAARKKNL